MLSLMEGNTVLLKAPYNLPLPIERLPREQSLCSATILQNDTAVFEDLKQNSAPGVDISLILQLHFYAGHNLRTPEGYNIGTLYLFDGRLTPQVAAPLWPAGELSWPGRGLG